MIDNSNQRGRGDRSRINLEQEHEVRYWSRQLHCTEAQLRIAVQKVGTSATEVERLLHAQRRSPSHKEAPAQR
jgi:uncharacterized protein DUF3606